VSIPTIYHTWASVITKRASEYILHIYTVTLLMNFRLCRNYYIAGTWSCLHFWRWSGSIYNN